ncbi:NAD(P)-binding protein [Rhizoclosmatium globosum]|uniref:NAD(P)-binding protein n=1 Tax=Rhizoclosmatium globosum TaxID=329046 RepID=A0A1Y2BP01_9FUNG|nr:NAD(P)-binding protein [Rhizoclosmatium globosum]|eukprot:ORY36482.1 NAD(P)-binding protein [Rhizoclosmatium globosum]
MSKKHQIPPGSQERHQQVSSKYFQSHRTNCSMESVGEDCSHHWCNTGIGFAVAEKLAAEGASVFLASRDKQKGINAVIAIRKKIPSAVVNMIVLDLADLSQTRKTAEMVAERIGHIDVVICNAGIFNDAAFALHPIYNIETQLQTLAVVIVTSSGQKHVSMDGISYESLETNKNYPPMTLYGQSKLANMLFAVGLNTRYQSRIVATTVHPGEVATEIYRPPRFSLFWWLTPIVKLYQWWFHLPPSTAARTVLAAASFSIPDNEIRGQYFLPPGVISKDHHVLAKDETAADRLWKYSENICNKY